MGRRQHYVPQFYLRWFTSDGSSIGFFRLSDETYRKSVPVKSIMYDNWLYDDDNHIEDRLSKVESVWNAPISTLLGILRDGGDRKSERLASLVDERYHLLHFMCCTMTRTLGSLAGMQGLVSAMVDDMEATRPGFDPKQTEQLSQYDDAHAYAEEMLSVGGDLPLRLLDLDWVFLVNESGVPFMTSDNPVALLDSYFDARGLRPTYGLGSSGIQVFLPLTSQVCVVLLDGEVYETSDDVAIKPISDRRLIREINTLSVRNAFGYLAFNPSLPQCEVKGMARKRKDIVRSRLGVYEVASNKNLYAFENVRLDGKLLVPGIPIREESLSLPIPPNAAGPQRSYSLMVESAERGPEDGPGSFVARFRRSQDIL